MAGPDLTVTTVMGCELHLAAGVVDDNAVEAFTKGHCAPLALAIHDRTGWPLKVLVQGAIDWLSLADDEEVLQTANRGEMVPPMYLANLWAHVLVQRPDGRLVDIHGARTLDSVLADYEGSRDGHSPVAGALGRHRLISATRDDVVGLRSAAPASTGVAEVFVDAVLALPDGFDLPWPWQHTIPTMLAPMLADPRPRAESGWDALDELGCEDLLDEALRRGLIPSQLRFAAKAAQRLRREVVQWAASNL